MPVVRSGSGDGHCPVRELLRDGARVGVEVKFIETTPRPSPAPGALERVGRVRRVTTHDLARFVAAPAAAVASLYGSLPADPAPEADLGVTGHVLHNLLTGSEWGGSPPLNLLVGGGTPIEHEGWDCGPARAFDAPQATAIARALDEISADDLRRRFAPDVLARRHVYPDRWGEDPDDERALLELALDRYVRLRRLTACAAAEGDGLVVYYRDTPAPASAH